MLLLLMMIAEGMLDKDSSVDMNHKMMMYEQ